MLRERFTGLASLAIVGLVTLMPAQAEKGRVFYNGKVFTGEPEHPYAEAVAISGDKIVAVGAQADVMKAAGTDAEKIDVEITSSALGPTWGPGRRPLCPRIESAARLAGASLLAANA